ncbi:MAG TPA: hypothetical protein VGX92_03740 [Pyrinomonadaceae bacterium]|nr:hypothetical protein [Pyrinomonadaceae bacterium]
MRILIIGGTVFSGAHLVEGAQARGHGLALFNRGLHGPERESELLRAWHEAQGSGAGAAAGGGGGGGA